MFSVVCDKDIKPESIKPGEKIYLDTSHFLPFSRFLPKKPGEKKQGGGSKGGAKGSSRGGRGGRGGKGGFRPQRGGGNSNGGYRPQRGGNSSGGYRPPRSAKH